MWETKDTGGGPCGGWRGIVCDWQWHRGGELKNILLFKNYLSKITNQNGLHQNGKTMMHRELSIHNRMSDSAQAFPKKKTNPSQN